MKIANMMNDLYETMGVIYNPSKGDVDGFADILDYNKDGYITSEDVLSVARSILCGYEDSNAETLYKTDYHVSGFFGFFL